MTSKMHILDRHVKEVLWKEEAFAQEHQKKPRGLGATSEQAIGKYFLYIDFFQTFVQKCQEFFEYILIFNFHTNFQLSFTESSHFDFNDTWKKYKRLPKTEDFDKQLLKAVVAYNSGHL